MTQRDGKESMQPDASSTESRIRQAPNNLTYGEFAIAAYDHSPYLACYSITNELAGRHHDQLTPGELIFWLAGPLTRMRICDFFSAGGTFYAREALAALEQIGAAQLASRLGSAIKVVGLPDPMPEVYDYQPSPEQRSALATIEAQPSRSPFEELHDRLFSHLKQHVRQFCRPNTTLTAQVLGEQLLPGLEIRGKLTHIVRCRYGFGPDGRRLHERDLLAGHLQLRVQAAEAKQQPEPTAIYRAAIERLRCVPEEEGVSQWVVTDSNGHVSGYSTPQRLLWIWPEGYPEYDKSAKFGCF
jgi:hypothetical protein